MINPKLQAQQLLAELRADLDQLIRLHDQCIQCHKEIKQYNKKAKAPVACFRCHIRK